MVRLVDPSQVHLHWTERWHLDYFRKSTVLQCPKIHSGVCWYIRCAKHILQSSIRNNNGCRAISIWRGSEHIEDQESLLDISHFCKATTCLQRNLDREQPNNRPSIRIHKETVFVTWVILTMLALFHEDVFAARCYFLSG
jgi:hypothetical protein